MENKKEFRIANLSQEELSSLNEMEQKLKERYHNDIVLIAYEPKDKVEQ